MIDYCKLDVDLLKAGCEAFQQEFERQAGFNPMAKCITHCECEWDRLVDNEPAGSTSGTP